MKLTGKVTQGIGDYGQLLAKYADVYRKATGIALFPGTLNLELPAPYDLPEACQRIESAAFGGAVNVNLVPCRIFGRRAFILRWRRRCHRDRDCLTESGSACRAGLRNSLPPFAPYAYPCTHELWTH